MAVKSVQPGSNTVRPRRTYSTISSRFIQMVLLRLLRLIWPSFTRDEGAKRLADVIIASLQLLAVISGRHLGLFPLSTRTFPQSQGCCWQTTPTSTPRTTAARRLCTLRRRYGLTRASWNRSWTTHAEVNAKENQGETPLQNARKQGNTDVAEVLRQHGGHE